MSKNPTVTISLNDLNTIRNERDKYEAFNNKNLDAIDQKDNAIRILREDMNRLRGMVQHESLHAAELLKMNNNLRDMQKKEKVAFTNLDNSAMQIRDLVSANACMRHQLTMANKHIAKLTNELFIAKRDAKNQIDKLNADSAALRKMHEALFYPAKRDWVVEDCKCGGQCRCGARF